MVRSDGRLAVEPHRWARLRRGLETGAAIDSGAAVLCEKAMRAARMIGGSITAESALSARAEPIGCSIAPAVEAALEELQETARKLDAAQSDYRAATLDSIASGTLTAADALASIDAVRALDRIVHHAWRSAAHLLGRGMRDDPRAEPAGESPTTG